MHLLALNLRPRIMPLSYLFENGDMPVMQKQGLISLLQKRIMT